MKGICFKEELFNLTVKGTKTQTRRIVESPKNVNDNTPETLLNEDGTIGCILFTDGLNTRTIKPRYKIGETLYLNEPYHTLDDGIIAYKYSLPNINTEALDLHWKNKLFAIKSAAHYFIKITGVRAERLQDISNEDCVKEGIFQHISHAKIYWKNGFDDLMYENPQQAYKALINLINGKDLWDKNPFVWVYDYKLTEK